MLKVLSSYIEFENTESFGTRGSNGTINKDLLSQFLDCKLQGYVKEIDLSIISSKKINVGSVYILIDLTSEERKKRKSAQNERQRKLDANNLKMCQRYKDEKAIENKTPEEQEMECLKAQKEKAMAKKGSGVGPILRLIINSCIKKASVDISNIHLRVDTDSGSYGIILESLKIARNENLPKGTEGLVCRLNGLKMYADPPPDKKLPDEMKPFMEEMQRLLESDRHEWVFSYSTGDNNNIFLEIPNNPGPNKAVYNVFGFFPRFSVNLTKNQYNRILCSLSGDTISSGNQDTAKNDREAVLHKAVSIIKRNRFSKIIDRRRKYIDTYKLFLESSRKKYIGILGEIEKYESTETILLYRYTALAESTKSFQEKLKAHGIDRANKVYIDTTLMKLQSEDQDEKPLNTAKSLKSDLRKLYESMMEEMDKEEREEKKGESSSGGIAKSTVSPGNSGMLLRTELSMKSFEITLSNEAGGKEPILQANLNSFITNVEYGNNGGLKVSFNLNEIGLTGAGNTKILERKKPEVPMFKFTLDKEICLTMEPFFLTFEDYAIGKILEFLVPPQGINVAKIGVHLRELFGMYSLLARDELIERILVPGPGEGLLGVNFTVALFQPTIRMYGDNGLEADIDVKSIKLVSKSTNSPRLPELIIQTGLEINVDDVSFSLKRNSDDDDDDDDDDDSPGSVTNVVMPFSVCMNLGLPVYITKDREGTPIHVVSSIGHVNVCLDENVLSSSLELLRPFLDRLFPIINNYVLSLAANSGSNSNSDGRSCKIGIEEQTLAIKTGNTFKGISLRWSDSKTGALLLESSLSGLKLSCMYAQFLLNGSVGIESLSMREHFSGAPCELLSISDAKVEIKDTNGSHADLDCSLGKVVSALNVCSIAQTVDVGTKLATSLVPIVKETILPIVLPAPSQPPPRPAEDKPGSDLISLENISVPMRLKLKVHLNTLALNAFDPEASLLLDIADLSSAFAMSDSFELSLGMGYLSAGVAPRTDVPPDHKPKKMVVLGVDPPDDNKKGMALGVKFVPKTIRLDVKTKISNVRADTRDLRELMNFVARTTGLFSETKVSIKELQKELEKGEEKKKADEEDAVFGKLKDFLFLTPPEKLPTICMDVAVNNVVLDFVPPFAPHVSIRVEVPSVTYKNSKEDMCGTLMIKDVRMESLGHQMLDCPLRIKVLPSIEIDREAKELRIGVSCGMQDVYFVVVPEQVPSLMYLAVGGIQSMFSSVSSDTPFPSFLKIEIKQVMLPSVLVQLRRDSDIRTTAMEILIQRINVKGTILPDKQEIYITGRRLLVSPIKDPEDARYNLSKRPSEEGDDTVTVRITRSVDLDAFRYGVNADVSELKINDFNARSIFKGLLPFAAGISVDFAKNICLPPCEKDRIPTLVGVAVNLPDIAVCVQDTGRVNVTPMEITFGVNFHGAILGADFGVNIPRGLSVHFPAGPEIVAVPSFSVNLSTKEAGGLTKVSVGDVRCSLSPSVGSNVVGKFLKDMFEMTTPDEAKAVEEEEIVVVTTAEKDEIVPDNDSLALHPVLEKMKVCLTLDSVTLTCRKSENEPGNPLAIVSKITAETPMLSELIGGAEPAQVAVDSVRATPSRASLSILLSTIYHVMNCVNMNTKSYLFLSMSSSSSSMLGSGSKKPAAFTKKDVSRLLSLLPSIRVESNVSLIEVVWKKLFSVAISSVALGCSLEHKKAITVNASVEKIRALDIHEVTTHGFVLLDTPTDTKFISIKGALSESGVEVEAKITSLTVTLTPDTINSFVEDSKWLVDASSPLVSLSESISAAIPSQKKVFLLPISVKASVGGISILMYENYNTSFAILSADVGVKNAVVSLRPLEDGTPCVEGMEVVLSKLSAKGRLGNNTPVANIEFSNVSSSLGRDGPLKVCCVLDVAAHAENLMQFVNRLMAMDFSSFDEKVERHVDEDHKEWEITSDEKYQAEEKANVSFVMGMSTKREESIESKYPALKAISLVSKALRQKIPVELDCSIRARLYAKGYGSFSLFVQDLEFMETSAQEKSLSFGLAVSHMTKAESVVSLCDKKYVKLAVENTAPDNRLKVSVSMEPIAVSVPMEVLKDLLATVSIAMNESASYSLTPSAIISECNGQEVTVFNKCNAPKLTVKKGSAIFNENTFSLEGWGRVKKVSQLLKGCKNCLKFKNDSDPSKALYLVICTGDGALTFTVESTFSVTNKTHSDIALCFGQTGGPAPDDEALALGRGTVIPRRSVGSAPPQFIGERDNMRIKMITPDKRELWSEPFSMSGDDGEWVLQPCFVDPDTKAKSYVTVICKKRVKSALRVQNCSMAGETAPTFECLILPALIIKNALPAEISLTIQDRKESVSYQLTVPETEAASPFCIKRQENIELRIDVVIASRYKSRLKLSARYPSFNNYKSLNDVIKRGKASSLEFEDPLSQVARVLSVSLSDSVYGEDGVWVLRFDYQYKIFNYLPLGFTARNELDLSTPARPQKLVACDGEKIRLYTRNDSVITIPTDRDDIYDLEAKLESCVVTAKVSTKTRSVVLSSYYRIANHTGRRLCVRQQSERKKKELTLESESNEFLLCEKANDGGVEENTQITLQVDDYEESSAVKLQELSDNGTAYIKIVPKGEANGLFKILHIVNDSHPSYFFFLIYLYVHLYR